jgi:hypothetical protein
MLPIAEFFGYAVADTSPEAKRHRDNRLCPFLAGPCTKRAGNGERLGTCSRAAQTGGPIVICPVRFASGGEALPRIIASEAEPGKVLAVVPEVPVGQKIGRLDWVLADLAADGSPEGTMYGVEAQAVDTTGSLKPFVDAYFAGDDWNVVSHPSGINWKNVWKRIVPQILRKGRLFEAQHSRLYVIMQDVLVDYNRNDMGLEEARPGEDPNVIFYAFHLQPNTPGPGYELVLRDRFKTTLRRIETAVGDVTSLPTRAELGSSVQRRVAEAGIEYTGGVPVVPRTRNVAPAINESGVPLDEVAEPEVD